MSVAPYDQILTLYRTLLVFGTVAVIILAVGLVEFVYFEPPGQTTGATAHIVGVSEYDPATGTVKGPDRTTFARDDQFAAVVDWSQLPPEITVEARWFNSFGSIVGRVGPGTPSMLGKQSTVPVIVPPGLHHSLPGHYMFVVERLKDGQPVEVLGRRIVLVERQ
ncbi:MAG: hypothetical protein PVS3B2_05870 [Candidatus Dormibacteraceae bacterium]